MSANSAMVIKLGELHGVKLSNLKEKLEKHLHELKEEYRQILVMRFIDDLKVAEISEIIGKTKTNVRVTIHRALASLRKEMENDLNVKKYV